MLRRLFTALRPVARLSAPLGRVVAGRRFLTVWAMVEYRGRRSGRRYRTPLAVHRTTDGFVFPVAFGRGDGSEWRNPMGVVCIGGLLTSTFLTLLVVPVVYTLIDEAKEAVQRALGRSPEGARAAS